MFNKYNNFLQSFDTLGDNLEERAQAANRTVWVSIFVTLIVLLVIILNAQTSSIFIYYIFLILLAEIGLVIAFNRGHDSLGRFGMIVLGWILFSTLSLFTGGTNSIALMGLVVVVAIATINNTRFGQMLLSLSVLSELVFFLLEYNGMLPPRRVPDMIELRLFVQSALLVTAYYALKFTRQRLKNSWQEIHQSALRYQALLQGAIDGIFIIDFDYRVIESNTAAAALLGYTSEQLHYMPAAKLLKSGYIPPEFSDELLAGRVMPLYEQQLIHKSGHEIDVEMSITLVHNTQGEPLYIQVTCRDVTDRKNTERELREIWQRYKAMYEDSEDAIFLIGLDMVNMAANHQAAVLTGYSTSELVGMPVAELIAPEETMDSEKLIHTLAKGTSIPRYERTVIRKDGSRVSTDVSASLVYDRQGNPRYIQSVVRDISKHKQLETQLKASLSEMVVLAATDELTNVNNRRTISTYVNNQLRRAWLQNTHISLILIDIDDLKGINDEFGHHIGDVAIQKMSVAMMAGIRSSDLAGRWAGDEFLVALPDTTLEEAQYVAKRIHEKIQAVDDIDEIKGRKIGASLGVVSTETHSSASYILDELLQKVDQAMYAAKQAGRDQIIVYTNDTKEAPPS